MVSYFHAGAVIGRKIFCNTVSKEIEEPLVCLMTLDFDIIQS